MDWAEYPIPPLYLPKKVKEVWRVPYQQRALDARNWAQQHHIQPASADQFKIQLVLVDVQNTFCIPEFELFVGGRSGLGAVEDNQRLCEFIYRNLGSITQITATMDTHQIMQIFHSIFLIDDQGNHPDAYTLITKEDINSGRWHFNPQVAEYLNTDVRKGEKYLRFYVNQLAERGKYSLTIWPYHAMLGGIGHALVSAVEEAIFFHSIARYSQPTFEIKGSNPYTEHYSVIKPEIIQDEQGKEIGQVNNNFIENLKKFDATFITGQAKSHCVAFTLNDLLSEINKIDPGLSSKIYILEDCTSPVVIPDVIDYTDQANEIFEQFRKAGMHIVHSVDPLNTYL